MNIYMQLSGLAIMTVLLYFFFRQKRVGLYTERIFLETLIVSTLCLLFDMSSIIAINHMDQIHPILLAFLCKTYLISIMWVGAMAFVYIIADVVLEQNYLKLGRMLTVILLLESIVLYVLPIYYHNDADGIYTYGSSVIMTYVFTIIYIIAAFISVFKNSKRMSEHREAAFLAWISLWIIAAIIQFAHNELLLVGFACSLGMMILFVALENPESNMDRFFNCFHSNAFDKYLEQCFKQKETVAILLISMTSVTNASYDSKTINHSILQLVQFLQTKKTVKVFKSMEQELVAVFPDMSEMTTAYQTIQDEFYADQYYKDEQLEENKEKQHFPNTLFVLVPESSIVDCKEDVYRLLQHMKAEHREITQSQVCYVNQVILSQMKKKDEVKRMILDALDEDRVEVFFQPIYSVKEQAFVSAEALVRIRKEDGSIVPPGVFIPVAEETGLIGKLGERVFKKTCEFLRDSNITNLGVHYIEVNLSVVQCDQRDLADRYIRIMNECQINPWLINLEITETGSVQTKKVLLDNMKKLIDYGVSFSLDDFGNGQSNLDYVIDMPVSIMKLDMNMTQSYFKSLKAQFVMRAAIGMAHEMDLFLVAEGVETKEQLDTMAELNIDYIQGYYFSKPLPADEFVAFIKKHHENKTALSLC